MIMGLSDILDLAKTPQKREAMRKSLFRLMDMKDEDIDLSDMPENTDYSKAFPAKPYFEAMRARNLKREQERLKAAELNS